MDKYVYSKCANVDINSMECGREKCAPCHSYGPAIRQYCLVHYVESGKGIFEIDGKIHHVSAGQIFYIPPKIITYYEADKNDPWEYKWVGIEGRGVERTFENGGLNKENAVMYVDSALSDIIDELICKSDDDLLGITALVYEFLSCLGARAKVNSHMSSSEIYVGKAVDYIHGSIHRKITVSEISSYLNIDRSYLTSVFKNTLGVSPQQYILAQKMDMACHYLESTDYDISYIGQSVGCEDLFAFSHAFKRIKGVSPAKYRKK